MKSRYENLFQPMMIGNVRIRNRIVMSPMQTRYVEGTADPSFNHWYAEYFKARAKGGVGLIITGHIEADQKFDRYPVNAVFPALDCEQKVKDFAEVTEIVHRYGAKIAAELCPGSGRIADIVDNKNWPSSASEVPMLYYKNLTTRAMTKAEIAYLAEEFGKAAQRAKKAGFDILYVHIDSYLLDQFASECWNKRTDEYGGSIENRLRFARECVDSARKLIGNDFPIIVGLALDHGFEGGRKVEQTIELAKEIEKWNIQAFHMRAGSYDNEMDLMPNAHYPDGYVLQFSDKFRAAVRTPMIIDGKFGDPAFMSEIIDQDRTDFIGMGRQLLADPEWCNKVRTGRENEVRYCLKCMKCFERIVESKFVECAVNPELGHEREAPVLPTAAPKKVLVVGGGAAGMEAAKTAASRGHKVVLIEKSDKLGGKLISASVPDYKQDIERYREWQINELNKQKVEVRLNTAVNRAVVEEIHPDVIIAACGSEPFVPGVEGVTEQNFLPAEDVLNRKVACGQKAVVVGGGLVGCEAAYVLAKEGRQVEIIEMQDKLLADCFIYNAISLKKDLDTLHVVQNVNTRMEKITEDGVVVRYDGGERLIQADSVINATGYVPDDRFFNELQDLAPEVYRAGDAVKARNIFEAVHDGYVIAKEL